MGNVSVNRYQLLRCLTTQKERKKNHFMSLSTYTNHFHILYVQQFTIINRVQLFSYFNRFLIQNLTQFALKFIC